jgi:hypothetical protein
VKLEINHQGMATPILSGTCNKWLETWQQGFARSDDISCKSVFALNPSTTELADMMSRPEVQQHCLTRNELTFMAPKIPKIQDMIQILEDHSKAMVHTALVSCSLQDQLADMERSVKRSVLTFWPEVMAAKLREHREGQILADEKKGKNEISRFQPEGGLIRWMNKRTGKCNGVVLRTNITGRTTEISSWNGLVNLAALATTCAEDPVLFLGIQGHEQFISHGQNMQNLWFLAIDIKRVAEEELKTYLPYFQTLRQRISKTFALHLMS